MKGDTDDLKNPSIHHYMHQENFNLGVFHDSHIILAVVFEPSVS